MGTRHLIRDSNRCDRLRVGWLSGFSFITSTGRSAAKAKDALVTSTHSHTSPSILVSEDNLLQPRVKLWGSGTGRAHHPRLRRRGRRRCSLPSVLIDAIDCNHT